jgi:hypothetical protein
MFPYLFHPTTGTPFLELLKERLEKSRFTNSKIEIYETKEYLQTPLDVIKYRCFGQTPAIKGALQRENLDAMSRIF